MPNDAIVAELPRSNDQHSKHLRQLVEQFQVISAILTGVFAQQVEK